MSNIRAFVPIEINMDRRLTPRQKSILIALYSFKPKDSNIVNPSRRAIKERCCGMDLSDISNGTTELVGLGWLIKEGNGGRSKSNHYQIVVPEIETVVKSTTVKTMAKFTTVNGETVVESNTKTVVESITGKELNTELKKPYAHSAREAPDSAAESDSPDLEIFPEIKNRELVQSWMVICRTKKVPVNQAACDRIRDEAKISGIPIEQALTICRDKNWAGFKNAWMANLRKPSPSTPLPGEKLAASHQPARIDVSTPSEEQWQRNKARLPELQKFKRVFSEA